MRLLCEVCDYVQGTEGGYGIHKPTIVADAPRRSNTGPFLPAARSISFMTRLLYPMYLVTIKPNA